MLSSNILTPHHQNGNSKKQAVFQSDKKDKIFKSDRNDIIFKQLCPLLHAVECFDYSYLWLQFIIHRLWHLRVLTPPYEYMLLWVWLGLTFDNRNRACDPPCSVSMYRGMGNRVCKISWASSTGAWRSCLKFSYSGMSWYFKLLHCAIV